MDGEANLFRDDPKGRFAAAGIFPVFEAVDEAVPARRALGALLDLPVVTGVIAPTAAFTRCVSKTLQFYPSNTYNTAGLKAPLSSYPDSIFTCVDVTSRNVQNCGLTKTAIPVGCPLVMFGTTAEDRVSLKNIGMFDGSAIPPIAAKKNPTASLTVTKQKRCYDAFLSIRFVKKQFALLVKKQFALYTIIQ